MIDKPTDEQIKEFWEHLGFTHPNEKQARWAKDPSEWWLYPNKPTHAQIDPPDIDLNNLFKYAVSNIMESNQNFIDIQVRHYIPPWYDDFIMRYTCEIWSDNGQGSVIKQADTPALALFWAIWEVIHTNT